MTATDDDDTATDRSIVDTFSERLTNDELVLVLLAQHGGRMTQSDIFEATAWSTSKVSNVLREMADAEKIVKIEYGPGHIVLLPTEVPDIVDR